MCTLPKPPAGRALSEGKEAPQAAFPSWGFPAQTKRRTEGLRVPVPLAWGGSSTARVLTVFKILKIPNLESLPELLVSRVFIGA